MSETTLRHPCQAFSATGHCKFGERCKFVHQVVSAEASSSSGSPINMTYNVRRDKSGNELCYFFKAGCCRKGDKCIWSHDLKDTPTPSVDRKGETKTKKIRQRRGQKEGTKKEGEREALRRKEEGEALKRQEEEREALRRKEETEALKRQEEEREALRQKEETEALKRQEEEREALRQKEETEALRRRKEEEELEARRKQREEEERIAREAEVEARRKAQQARAEEERKAKQAKIAEREATVVHRHVVMDAALVTCGAGLDVQNIVCGFESCYLTINNLPKSAKRQDVEELFAQKGVNKNLFYIVKMRRVNEDTEARIMSDAEVGQTIAGLDGMEFGDGKKLDITVTDEERSPNKMGSAFNLNAKTVIVTWKIPSVSMVAEYDTPNAASDAVKRLDNSIFSGRKIRAELMNQGGINITTSVKFWGLPLTVTEEALKAVSGAYLVWRLHPRPNFSAQDIERELRKTVLGLGNLEAYDISPSDPNKFIAEARLHFHTRDGAKMAHTLLNDQRLRSDFPRLRASLKEPIQYVVTIPLAQYRAQKGRWDSMAEGDKNKAAFIRITNNGIDRAFIRVLGKDKKAVGQLKVRVEDLVGGEALDISLCHSSFLGANGQRFLEDISSQTRAYLRGDWKTKTLRLYADRDARDAAVALIKAEVTRLESSERSVSIPRRSIGFFMRKGLQMLQEELGEDAVILKLDPSPRLIIRGGEEAHQMVNRLIEESRSGVESLTKGSDQNTCPICFDDVTSPVFLTCGHVYCTACLRHFLSSAAERKAFPLLCAGDEDRCKAPIAIPIIQRFLLQQQFDQLIEAAVTTYIERHPNKFRYCTTPDCPQVYRCEEGRKALRCPSCFATVCTECHKEAHEGMTCQERKILNDDAREQERLNAKWAQDAGAKRCPDCSVWIQKIAGCNHMTCKCGAQICWRCLETFPNARAVHAHLHKVHGGVRDIEPMEAVANLAHMQYLQSDLQHQRTLEEEHVQSRAQEEREQAWLVAEGERARMRAEEREHARGRVQAAIEQTTEELQRQRILEEERARSRAQEERAQAWLAAEGERAKWRAEEREKARLQRQRMLEKECT